jgi:hypothetical protein
VIEECNSRRSVYKFSQVSQKEEDNWRVRRKFEYNVKMCLNECSVRMLSRLCCSGSDRVSGLLIKVSERKVFTTDYVVTPK